MVSYNFLPHLMNDPFTLSRYMGRRHMDWESFIKKEKLDDKKIQQENWMLSGHLADSFIPDHVYTAWNDELKQGVGKQILSLKDVFLSVLPKAAGEIFELDGNLIVIKDAQLDYWQHLCKSFSPLVLGVAFLWLKKHKEKNNDIVQSIKENFDNTAIPGYKICKDWTNEVADVHIHFNSGLEADYKWLEAVKDPKAFVEFAKQKKCLEGHQRKGVINDYDTMYKILKEAADYLSGIKAGMNKTDRNCKFDRDLSTHAWIIYHCFLYLNKNDNNKIKLYRFQEYLLIAGTFRKFFVMQYHQVGLEQFNHVLHAPFKGPYDASDNAQQLLRQQVNDKSHLQIKCIEFRIGANQLVNIAAFKEGFMRQKGHVNVGFVCSLIKTDKELKKKLDKNLREISKHVNDIVAIDVAGKDYKASPSEFVDAFAEIRKMKKQSPWRFTYHAGEDFYHILTGLRMIYEAVTLLGLQPGDRIGHASAAGVDPRNWARCIHGVVPIKLKEYWEDLKFIKDFIEERNIGKFRSKISEIDDYITNKLSSAEPDKIIKVDCFQFFDEEELRILQKELLFFIAEKGIVIEACPTSNICIGYDHSLRSYHLRTWFKWKYIKRFPIPDIVIGSDEIGVFPTNISNEYACVYEMIMMDDELKPHAKDILDDLARNSMKYTFMTPL